MVRLFHRVVLHCVTFLMLTVSCASISRYSPVAYEKATSLKVEALTLMDKATNPYAKFADQVTALRTDMDKAYEYAKGLPKNSIATKQWAILKNPEGHLLGGFLVKWEKDSTLTRFFVDGTKDLVSDAFDTIIGLESGKIKPNDLTQ